MYDSIFFTHWRYHWTVSDVYLFLVNCQVWVLPRPLPQRDWALGKIYFIEVNELPPFPFGGCNFFQAFYAFLSISFKGMSRHVFFLSDLLPPDSILQVESPEGSDSDAFVREVAVKPHTAQLHGETCPQFEISGVKKKIYMLLLKFACFFFEWEDSLRFQRFPTNMLNFILSEVQSFCYNSICHIFEGLLGWLCISEPKHKCCFEKFTLKFLRHFLILHFFKNYILEIKMEK